MERGEAGRAEDWARIAKTVAQIGRPGFAHALTDWLRQISPYTFTVVFGYQGEVQPLALYNDFPAERRQVFVTDYLQGPYLLDPFCQAPLRLVEPGLYRLKSLAPDRFYQGEYFRTYYKRTEIAEELGYFAPLPGKCHIVLSLMREDRVFSAPEFRRLAAVAPLVCALLSRHWAGLAETFARHNVPPQRLIRPGLEGLTPREREIVGWILKGYSAEATGDALGIKRGTVRIHRRNIYARLGISSQRELFARFMGDKPPAG